MCVFVSVCVFFPFSDVFLCAGFLSVFKYVFVLGLCVSFCVCVCVCVRACV